MTFEEYLISKKIDANLFQQAEAQLYESWRIEFEQLHPNSFTAQKLYLINPLRRKYILKQELIKPKAEISSEPKAQPVAEVNNDNINATVDDEKPVTRPNSSDIKPQVDPSVVPSAKPARPVFKPKPKIN